MSERKNKSVRAQIRKANVSIICIIVVIVVCSTVNLLLIDLFQFNENRFDTRADQMRSLMISQYQWVNDVKAVYKGQTPELNPESCSFGVWYAQNGEKYASDFQEELKDAAAYHNDLHKAGEEYITYRQAGTEDTGGKMEARVDEASEKMLNAMEDIAQGYARKAEQTHKALISRIIWAICTTVVLAVLAPILARRFGDKLAKKISEPIKAVADWSKELSVGSANLDFDVSGKTDTDLLEVQQMIDSFRIMAQSIQENVRVVKKVADGDMTAFVNIRSSSDSLGKNLYRMVQSNDLMFGEITDIANSVAEGADSISQASTALAESCSVQAGAVKDFTEIIEETDCFIADNNQKAGHALRVSDDIQAEIEDSSQKMEHLLSAMGEIREASEKVSAIIQTIDSIASQTNLLALNAAIEAARAGEAGKGFAVVADEVKDLAQKSSEAAEESKKLIHDTVEKTVMGDNISQETSVTFHKIADSVGGIISITKDIAEAGIRQKEHIKIARDTIQSISDAIDGNAAASEEAAAASDELNQNAINLKESMKKFNLRKREPGKPYIPPEKKNDPHFIKEAEENYKKAKEKGKVKY